MKQKKLTTLALLALSTGSLAADWSGKGQLGFAMASGNTDTKNLNASVDIKRESEKWIMEYRLEALLASSNDVETAERYAWSGKTGYKISDKDNIFYYSRYEQDKFSGYDYSMSGGIGWGHKFYETETGKLLTELGLGYKSQAVDIDRSKVEGAMLFGKVDFMKKLTETVVLEDSLLVEATEDNTFIQNDFGFSFKVSDSLAVKLAHQIRHNTDTPVGIKSTDTLVSANLVYDF